MQDNWLVPFRGRNSSGAYNQNFLWGSESVYIMDNHRAALWCWLQHIPKNGKSNLIHIDRHTDTLYSRIEEWRKHLPSLWGISIDRYLDESYESEDGLVHLFRWDNYLSLFLECYGHLIDKCFFATHGDGDPPRFNNVTNEPIWDVPANLEYWLSDCEHKWIVDVDLDYFFCEQDASHKRMVSETYIEALFQSVSRRRGDGAVGVLTLCLSPECCGGWEASEELCERVCSILEIDFKLPEGGLNDSEIRGSHIF